MTSDINFYDKYLAPMQSTDHLLSLIPKAASPSRFKFSSLLPRGRTSPLWYLSWPRLVIDLCGGGSTVPMYFCYPAFVEEATEFRPKRQYGAYCGAPPGVRCRCGAQLAGHDPGDEQ